MRKIAIITLLGTLGTTCFAQHSLEYAAPDADFRTGTELYQQQKYAAAANFFEQFLQQADPTYIAQRDEAMYYLAATAYAQRQSDALQRTTDFLTQHPYSNHASQLHLMAGVLLLEQKKGKPALEHLEAAVPKSLSDAEKADLAYYKGTAYLQQGKFAKASEQFAYLTDKDTHYKTSASYYYAYCLYAQKQYAAALPLFLEIEKLPEYKDIAPYYICQIYYAQGNYDEVIGRANTLLANNKNNKSNSELYRILGEIYYNRGNYSQAIDYLKKYEQNASPVSRNDMYLLGMSLYHTGDYKNCIGYLSKVTSTRDALAENAYLHIGNSYVKTGDKNNARMAFGAAAKTNFDKETHEEALYNYALATSETTDAFGESVSAISQFLDEYPNSKYADKAYQRLSDVLMNTKNYQAAYRALTSMKTQSSQMADTKQYLLYQMGAEAYTTGQLSKSIEYFTTAIDAKSSKYLTESYYWRGESYYRLKKYPESVKDFEQFFAQSNATKSLNYTQALYASGYAYFNQKNYTKAIAKFTAYTNKADKKQPAYADALNRIGDCHFSARNLVQAESYYNKVMAIGTTGSDYATFQRGYVLGLLKKYDEKISVLNKMASQHSASSYADDALYEIARAYIMKNDDEHAIEAYQKLLANYPNSNLARKAALETGMIYTNQKDHAHAIEAYKRVIKNYPGSEESYTALDAIEAAYIETDQVKEYIDYTKTLGRVIKTDAASREDSLTYVAAERQYITGNYKQAAVGMGKYVTNYCPGGRYCIMAQYYMADSYYRTDQKDAAYAAYKPLVEQTGLKYCEESCLRCAEISYDNKNYAASLTYFEKLQTVANSLANKRVAQLGILRCNYYLNDHANTIKIATQILNDTQIDAALATEARYNRARSYMATQKYAQAQADLRTLSKDLQIENGAEAKYMLADSYVQLGNLDKAEAEIMDFAEKNTPYQYWLARSLVLLADINMKRGDDFQAKQYLLSVQSNYNANDDIQNLVAERLQLIAEREKEKITE